MAVSSAAFPADPPGAGLGTCTHCGLQLPPGLEPESGAAFCCSGCEAAHALINDLGLERYYDRRCIDPAVRPLRPDEDATDIDYTAHVTHRDDGTDALHLMVEGMHCAACVWLIETVLGREAGVEQARLNMTTRRLVLRWRPGAADPNRLVGLVAALGYRLVPYDPARLGAESQKQEKELLRAMAVAGFAAGNVMLLSVSVWAGHFSGMGVATRDLMHWLSALIVLPAVVYAGRPFFRSAATALRAGRTNMDVPITLGVVLAAGMSLVETMRSGEHAYFDSAITLLFFLLVGRYLDLRARGRARAAGEHLLAMNAGAATVLLENGDRRMVPPSQVTPGMTVLAAAGERLVIDGEVEEGRSDLDASLISGETVPTAAAPGTRVFAGMVNLSGPLRLRVTAAGEDTLLASIVRLMEDAEQGRARYVAVADRVARHYAPVVHVLALGAFLGWWLLGGAAWQEALLIAVSVLIITCPCALALAVPAVQVIASGRLLRQGILVKSGTALERLAGVDTVVFDKTGTITTGKAELIEPGAIAEGDLTLAASLAVASRHPLARALVRAAPHVAPAPGVREVPGQGMEAPRDGGLVRLGSRAFCGVAADARGHPTPGPEMWLARPGTSPILFAFADRPRADARDTFAVLQRRGLRVVLLSGDRPAVVDAVAAAVGIDEHFGGCTPADKCERLAALAEEGCTVAMVGDGLNDAPALAAAHVSLSPSTAIDVSQTVADMVFQGERLAPVAECLEVARRGERLVRQNFALALVYNTLTIPLALAGLVTPLVAAVAMSSSSLLVIGNALRLGRRRSA